MRLLLDTHALLWAAHQPASLSPRARAAISDGANDIFVSAVSAMEIATKNRKRMLEFDTSLATDFTRQLAASGFRPLPVSGDHAQRAGSYRIAHKDPWDRLLVAQAEIEDMTLVTTDAEIAGFGVATYW